MIPKGTRLYSILHHKCPRCHEGSLYCTGPYQKGFTRMHEKCSQCGLQYAQEPSFYSGAMYVSYALQVALFTTVYVALRVLFNPAAEVYMITIIGAAFVLFPVTFRLSRAIYLNFFFSYDADAKNIKP
ncbi:MAG: DUF983 domain-containing protein [Cyclobacteriaceae bacterium]|nr:DUF983 domain-containing protein [Cyclobacteriaceae bacterium]